MNAEILGMTRALLGFEDSEHDEILNYLINDAKNAVLAYCRLEYLPEVLQSYIPRMVYELWTKNGFGQPHRAKEIKSMSQGQRSISYGEYDTSDMLTDFEKRLKPFIDRRARTPSQVQYGI